MYPIDKTRIFLNIFCIFDTWEGKIERCYQSPSMGWVLVCPQHFRSNLSLSLDGVENPEKKWSQNMTMMVDQSQTKSIDPE